MPSKYGFESPDERREKALTLLRKAAPVIEEVLLDLAKAKGWPEPEPTDDELVMAGWVVPRTPTEDSRSAFGRKRYLPSGKMSESARLVIVMRAGEGVDPHLVIWETHDLSSSELARLAKVLRQETTMPVLWSKWLGQIFYEQWEK